MYPEQVNNNYEFDGVFLYGLQGTSFYKETKENKVMVQLIDKSAVVAEIEKRRKDWRYGGSIEAKYKSEECDDILAFLDTLETKEVDVEKEIIRVSKNEYFDFTDWKSIARCFFELGIKAQKGK